MVIHFGLVSKLNPNIFCIISLLVVINIVHLLRILSNSFGEKQNLSKNLTVSRRWGEPAKHLAHNQDQSRTGDPGAVKQINTSCFLESWLR